ncbi:hypothetical protein [Mycoplasma leonicaptivi]|uniref:hypothetical protein n=1 Tax=Mycoplasma leonicaptivi TaxID=36742 RepID=UPI0004871802|nr:hypothetical protein [Mycoplasma leonicaptivi]
MANNKNKKKVLVAAVSVAATTLGIGATITGLLVNKNRKVRNETQANYDQKRQELLDLISKISNPEIRNELTSELQKLGDTYSSEGFDKIEDLIARAANQVYSEYSQAITQTINEFESDNENHKNQLADKYKAELEKAGSDLNTLETLKLLVANIKEALKELDSVHNQEKHNELWNELLNAENISQVSAVKEKIQVQIGLEKEKFAADLSQALELHKSTKRDIIDPYDEVLDKLLAEINKINTEENKQNPSAQNKDEAADLLAQADLIKKIGDIIFEIKDKNAAKKKEIVNKLKSANGTKELEAVLSFAQSVKNSDQAERNNKDKLKVEIKIRP